MKEDLGVGRSWYDIVEDEMATRNLNVTDEFDSRIDDQAKLEWLRREIQVGIDQIERGEGIEFASMEELEAEIDRMCAEVERESA